MVNISTLSPLPGSSQTINVTNSTASTISILTQPRKNLNLLKWNLLFDKNCTEWLVFKPKLGRQFYPCYACRYLFGSKNSFLDHVNRRGVVLKYKCNYCTEQDVLTFYNPCSFLLHTRQHYTLLGGQINLENLKVSMVSHELVGFLPHPDVPPIYDVEDDDVGKTMFINNKFYSPINECMGNSIVNLFPNELLIYYHDEATREVTSLALKQTSLNIPRCQLILADNNQFKSILNNLNIYCRGVQAGGSYILNIRNKFQAPYINGPIISNNTDVEPAREQAVCELALPESAVPESALQEPAVQEPAVQEPALPESPARESALQEPAVQEPTLTAIPNTKINFKECPECKQPQRIAMSEHFLRTSQPFLQSLRCNICKYIAPTRCSLQAHERIHNKIPPFVCPECGRDFLSWDDFQEHMADVCFHLTKQVRIRCSGKRCGKIFAHMSNFSSHFLSHIQVLFKCTKCNNISADEEAFLDHRARHETMTLPTKLFKCFVCTDSDEIFTQDTLQDHIQQHAVCKFLYVYSCKLCHSYFRSPPTYAAHILRCTKLILPQVNPNLIIKQQSVRTVVKCVCSSCDADVTYELFEKRRFCPNCGSVINNSNNVSNHLSVCPLCNRYMAANELGEHIQKLCQYSKPLVMVTDCIPDKQALLKRQVFSPKSNSSISCCKRKRSKSVGLMLNKKQLSRSTSRPDLNIEVNKSTVMNGTYCCKVCHYTNKIRSEFQKHVVIHRNSFKPFQCMECGESFVVQSSLSSHLLCHH